LTGFYFCQMLMMFDQLVINTEIVRKQSVVGLET